LSTELSRLAQEGRKLDPAGALRVIGTVRQDTTLHAVCLVPHSKTMHVCIPAISEESVEFKLEEWLRRPIGSAQAGSHAPSKGNQP
jgi:hypothetical protein